MTEVTDAIEAPNRPPLLSKADRDAIEALARKLQTKQTHWGNPDYTLMLQSGPVAVRTVLPKPLPSPPVLGVNDLRGTFNFNDPKIEVSCDGVLFPCNSLAVTHPLVNDTVLQHIIRTLAHEATHAIQNTFLPRFVKVEAAQLNQAYSLNETETNYCAYLRCAPERLAHASMIAFDIWTACRAIEDAKKTWSYGYILSMAGASDAATVALDGVLDDVQAAYLALQK